jgi:transposase
VVLHISYSVFRWGDETAVVNTDVRGRSDSPKGETPVAFAVGGTRHKLSMISNVTNRGHPRWMSIDENFNAENLITFMQALTRNTPKKIFLILDNLRVHHSRVVKAWLEENKAKIEVFYLPSYSPQLNPDEPLNADLKQALRSTVAMRTRMALRNATSEYMTILATSPERVMSYFQDPRVKYAAWKFNRSGATIAVRGSTLAPKVLNTVILIRGISSNQNRSDLRCF